MAQQLKTKYQEQITPKLMEQFGYTNMLQVPKVIKVTINRGLGEAATNAKALESWTLLLTNGNKLNPFLRSQMLYPTSFAKYLPEIISKLRTLNNGQTANNATAKRGGNLGKYA